MRLRRVAAAALAGVGGSLLGYHWLDPAAAILVAGYILISGFEIGMENIHYLIGTAPDASTIAQIERAARSVSAVLSVHDVKAHYVGPFVHVALHVSIGADYSAKEAHDIGDQVTDAVEGLGIIDRAFVHVDPLGAA
ncbi:MAG: hypothetical protein KC466_07520 [Myxococcales bacterium]|nr:hypothetical protein [Myxococcales bacterium]